MFYKLLAGVLAVTAYLLVLLIFCVGVKKNALIKSRHDVQVVVCIFNILFHNDILFILLYAVIYYYIAFFDWEGARFLTGTRFLIGASSILFCLLYCV